MTTCPSCGKSLTRREYWWDHRHEPVWYIKAIGAVMMGVGAGSILVGLAQLVR